MVVTLFKISSGVQGADSPLLVSQGTASDRAFSHRASGTGRLCDVGLLRLVDRFRNEGEPTKRIYRQIDAALGGERGGQSGRGRRTVSEMESVPYLFPRREKPTHDIKDKSVSIRIVPDWPAASGWW